MKSTLRKIGIAIMLFGLVMFNFPTVPKTQAVGSITAITAAWNGTVLTVTATPATALTSGQLIMLRIMTNPPAEEWPLADAISSGADTDSGISAVARDNQGITATVGAEGIGAGHPTTIEVANLSAPSTSGSYKVNVQTKADHDTGIDGDQNTTSNSFPVGDVIYGTVTKSDGTTPVASAHVMIHRGNWQPPTYDTGTDENGYYSVADPKTGDWVVEVYPPMNAQGMVAPSPAQIQNYTSGLKLKDISFGLASKTITGKVARENGNGVANVSVNATKPMGGGGGFSNTTTNASGVYTLTIGGGDWQVMLCPGCGGQGVQAASDWAYSGPPMNVSFASNNSSESQTVNFNVVSANSTIKGKILKPDNTAPTNQPGQGSIGVNIFSSGGFGTGAGLNGDGSFEVKVPAGSYDINAFDPAGVYTFPPTNSITVKSAETVDLGTIKLIEKTDIIRGTVKTADGTPVQGIGINAMMQKRGGGDFGNTQSAADGSFSLRVTPGQWMVMAGDFTGQGGQNGATVNYVVLGGGKPVSVSSGVPSTVDFTAAPADATISGSLVDSDGALISDVYGFIMADLGGSASDEMKMMGGMGGNVDRGTFSFKVPAGKYSLNVNMPPGANYTPASAEEVTAVANDTVTTTITMLANDATISGYLVDEDGSKVTNLMGEVFANNAGRSMHPAQINSGDGSYSISVASAAGPWYMGAWTDPASGYFQEPPSQDGIAIEAGQTITKNITLRRANATITGKVTDNNGNALAGVFVSADTRTLAKNKTDIRGPMFMNDNRTGDDGTYTLQVPAGTYYVNAFVPIERGLIPPKLSKIEVAKDTTATADLRFRVPDSKITGTVKDADNSSKRALVWAYSEDGAYTEVSAGDDGAYELKVTKGDKWHIGANTEGGANNTDRYSSSDTLVQTEQNDSNSQDLSMTKTTNGLPASVNTSTDVTTAKSVKLTDSAQIDLPANSLGTENTATVSVSPSAEIGHQFLNKPLEDKAYDITAVDSTGSSISSLNSNATITLPYDPTILDSKGLNESTNDIFPAYWNDTDGTWTPISGASINKDSNNITFTTNHFTKYALVAASDVTNVSSSATSSSTSQLPATGRNETPIKVWLMICSVVALLMVSLVFARKRLA